MALLWCGHDSVVVHGVGVYIAAVRIATVLVVWVLMLLFVLL